MTPFVHSPLPGRIVFGTGSVAGLADEVAWLDGRRALVLCTPQQQALAESLAQALGDRSAGVFAGAVMHVPVEAARAARAAAAERGADCTVAVGGGSTIGLAKAVALEAGLPIVAVPTTYAGSEVTPIFGITEGGQKRTGRDLRVLPRTVIYDPALTHSLPRALGVTSGVNAMAHAVEGLYAQDANPISSLMAEEGLRALARALPLLAAAHDDARVEATARHDALYGAWLCGTVLAQVGMALHHKLCHTLGGSFDLPHAEVHTVVLPHALAYNAAAAPVAAARVAAALGTGGPAHVAIDLQALARRCGAPVSLAAIGMQAADLDRAADLACRNPYWNPRPVEHRAIRDLLQRAFDGAPPSP